MGKLAWLVLISALLPAQPLVTISPVPGSLSGVTLLGAKDATYLAAVQALIPSEQFAAYQPMLP